MVAAAGIRALWLGLERLLATNRGLDLTDEGLYLLAADPPTPYANYGFPFGWHTKVLFWLVGYDIANFRTSGAILLFISAGFVGWMAVRCCVEDHLLPGRERQWLETIGAATGAVGSLLFYGSLLSTPGYNWLNLFGIMVAASGYLKLWSSDMRASPQTQRLRQWLWSLLTATGLFLTIPAKPPSVALLYILGGFLMFVFLPLGQALRTNFIVILCLLACTITAVMTGLWHWPVVDYFYAPFKSPKFIPEHTVMGAVLEMLALPLTFALNIIKSDKTAIALTLSGSVFLLVTAFAQKVRRCLTVIKLITGLALVGLGCLAISSALPWFLLKRSPALRFADATVTTASILFALIIVLAALINKWSREWAHEKPKRDRSVFKIYSIVVFLGSLPFIFAFGTGNGPYRLAAMASGLFLVGAVAGCTMWQTEKMRIASSVCAFFFILLLAVAILRDSYAMPYRNRPLVEQTEPVQVGPYNSFLSLDPKTARQLIDLREAANASGWKPKTPLLGVVWDWASTVPYFLGAKVPDCLMLTLFNYPTSVDIARYRINNGLKQFDSPNAWILTSKPASLSDYQKLEISTVLQDLTSVSGRSFPQDYLLAAQSGNLQLWKPNYHTAVLHKK